MAMLLKRPPDAPEKSLLTHCRAHATPSRLILIAAFCMIASFRIADVKVSLDASQVDVKKQKSNDTHTSFPTGNQGETPSSHETSPYTFQNTDSIEHALPAWTHLPRTLFTDNVLHIIDDLNRKEVFNCGQDYSLIVTRPNTKPLVQCHPGVGQDFLWCETLTRIFASRTLPHNVSIAFVLNDKMESGNSRGCIGNSSPGGKLVMPNMQDIREMINTAKSRHANPEEYRYNYKVDVPWEKRNTTPVFRGTAWRVPDRVSCGRLLEMPRYKAVSFSFDYPELLDARLSAIDWLVKPCFEDNSTTRAFTRLLPVDRIDAKVYFSNFQVAVVLGGIGAAFRLSLHFMTSTAVVLEDFGYQEWFTKYLRPFVHFIPLSRDLHDLNETLHWVQDHPVEVQSIGKNGRAFWEKYLTFAHNEEHIYELVYRLSEFTHYAETNETTI